MPTALVLGLLTLGIAKNNPHAYDPIRTAEPATPLIAPARPAMHGSESTSVGQTHGITSEGPPARRVAEDLVRQSFAAKTARGLVSDPSPATVANNMAQLHIYDIRDTVDIVLGGPAPVGQQLDLAHTTEISAKELNNGTVTDSFDARATEGPASWKARASSRQAAEHITEMLKALG